MSVDLDGFLTPRMRELFAEDFPERSPQELEIQIEECLKFLYIASMSDGVFIPLTKEVDEIWHEMILQTKFYQQLCSSRSGRRFIHHESIGLNGYANIMGKGTSVKKFLEWLPKYVSHFGEFTERTAPHWVIVQFLMNELGMTLQEINEIGRREALQPSL
ncbi:hypothetical protein GCM10010466_47220 [Planomonospora alba]|uniref:Uncharacterized protein n=1 Tax=Planomonospora alba TaxID=161354 RepID=A0ABP6NKD4_9ACTN